MTKKKVLITGGAGFIGSNFANLFADQYDIVCLDNLQLGVRENLHDAKQLVVGDAANRSDLESCGTDFHAIIHLAGTSSAPMFGGDGLVSGYINSIASFLTTLEFARDVGAKKVLYASTSSLYGNNPIPLVEDQIVTPPNHYAVTKFCYEHAARCFGQVYPDLDIIGFRFMSVYGPNEEAKGQYANMISQFLWDIVREIRPVIYGDGTQFRDFTQVQDVAGALRLAVDCPKALGQTVYNIGRGEGTSFNDIFATIRELTGSSIEPLYIKNPVKEAYVQGQNADITKISTDLGFSSQIDLAAGIGDLHKNLQSDRIKVSSSELWWEDHPKG